jgi:CopG family nickel-responsive transcriptional regulator
LTASKPDKDTRIVSLSIPQATLNEIDRTVGEVGYPSRSELVRDAVRAFLRERAEVKTLSGHVNGIIILVYNHGCAAKVSEVRHSHMGVFKSFMHADFDGGDDCCEVLMFCGDAAKVKESYDALSATLGVKEARLFLA